VSLRGCRGFKQVPVVPRKRLLDALTSNLSVLNASIGAALAGGNDVDPMATQQQRSGLKAYVFFLHWATEQCEAEAREAAPAAAAAAGGRSVGSCLDMNVPVPTVASGWGRLAGYLC